MEQEILNKLALLQIDAVMEGDAHGLVGLYTDKHVSRSTLPINLLPW